MCCDLASCELRREACDLLDLKREYLDGIGDLARARLSKQKGLYVSSLDGSSMLGGRTMVIAHKLIRLKLSLFGLLVMTAMPTVE